MADRDAPATGGSVRRETVSQIPGFGKGLRAVLDFIVGVYNQAASDNIFFLASGLTFSLLLAAFPFLTALLALAGLILASQFEAPQSAVLDWLWTILPVTEVLQEQFRGQLTAIVDTSRSVGLIGAVLFVWFSTRAFGSLRTVLSQVFDVRGGPSILMGKLIDIRLVIVSTLLLVANIAITSSIMGVGNELLDSLDVQTGLPLRLLALAVAFSFIFLLFFLIYKFVPAARINWHTAAIAALFSAIGFELLKVGFGWYLTNVVDYSRVFYAFATLVVIVIAFYYASVIFILGGEVATVLETQRVMRRQREFFNTP